MSFLEEKMGWQPELNRGLIASVVFHIGILALVYFGVPNIFAGDIIVEPLGLKAVMLSDITAAPKVDKAGKPSDKPKKQVAEQTKKKEKAPAPEKPKQTAAVTPPPPPPEEKVVTLPDQEKPKEEEKPKDKKEPEKPKTDNKKKEPPKEDKKKPEEPDPLASLLNDVLNQPQAEPTPEPPKKNATPEPAEPTTGPQTPEVAAAPMSASDQEGIKQQLIPCWNFDPGTPNPEQYVVTVRVNLNKSTGQVLGTEILEKSRMSDPRFAAVANGAARALRNPACTPIKFPDGKGWDVIDIQFDLAKAIYGGF